MLRCRKMPIDQLCYMCYCTLLIKVHSFLTGAASLLLLCIPRVGLFERNFQPNRRATSRVKDLTKCLSPLDATLTKKWGAVIVN
jgi:hypothetical protein